MSLRETIARKSTQELMDSRSLVERSKDFICLRAIDEELAKRNHQQQRNYSLKEILC